MLPEHYREVVAYFIEDYFGWMIVGDLEDNNAAFRGVICRYMGYRLNRFDTGGILTSNCIYCSLDKRLPNGLRSNLTQS